MSLTIANLQLADNKKRNREQLLALVPARVYDDGRTKQCHRDECDIQKIMARYNKTGTLSHLAKYEGVYADFSDFDFHHQSNMLARGDEIFAELDAEIRREFGQDPSAFFAYVNDPRNIKDLAKKLPGLLMPGQQLKREASPTADLEAAQAAASEPASEKPVPAGKAPEPLNTPAADAT